MAFLLCTVIFILLIATLFTGELILKVFGISIPAFRIAGGIVVMIVGLGMIMGKSIEPITQRKLDQAEKKTDFKIVEARLIDILVPLGVPIFVGPGTAPSCSSPHRRMAPAIF